MKRLRLRRDLLPVLLACALLLPSATGCTQSDNATEVLEQVYLLNELSFELENVIGQKVWCLGVYGDTRFSDLGVGFLVLDYDMLIADEAMDEHSSAIVDGDLPPAGNNGDEILVYGEVSEFGETYGVFAAEPTPLITVEDFHVLREDARTEGWEDSFIAAFTGEVAALFAPTARAVADDAPAPTKPSGCDRALIISGGIDAKGNKPRYKENIKQEHKRLEEMGFSAGQIQVLYNDGGNVPGADGPLATEKSTKENIRKAFEKYAEEMEPSCTLALFVTDHGTGYNPGKGYRGERPALPDTSEYNQGKTYAENTFKADVRKKVYRLNTWTNADGVAWRVRIDKQTNRLKLYERVDGKWRYRGRDVDNDGRINESETNQDIDGDGDKDNVGWNIADLGPWKHKNNEHDTDRNGSKDVKIRWDTATTRYVMERLVGTDWKKMGEDTNGDFIIDSTDGGVDWNLDGDKNDKVGFHEGINLWGRETDSVLWDDEFVGMLKPLSDKGIHIVIHMAQCYSGGFVDNCEGVVEKIVTGAGEETIHWNRMGADGKYHALDLEAFLSNLNGIDVESWDYAFDKGKVADDAAWTAAGGDAKWRNTFGKWELPLIPTDSMVSWVNGDYEFVLRLPEALEGKVHDFEIIYGLQKPRWSYGSFDDAPLNYGWEMIPGGFRVKSDEPIPLTPQLFKFSGAGGDQRVRVQLTDREHKPIGYTNPAPTDALPDREKVLDALLWEPDVDVGWVGDYCEGQLSVDFGGIDLSGGDAPLARVVLKANGIVWHDSGLLPAGTTTYDHSVTEDVLCGQRFILDVEATNVYGQVVRETREVTITAPPKQQEWTPPPVTPPPYGPPPDGEPPPTQTILQAAVAVSGESVRDGEACTSTVTISYDGTDLTGGDYPVTRVVMTVNGSPYDSGAINQTQFHNSVTLPAACGQTFNISVTVTNSIGKTATSSGSYTTPVP